MYSYNRQASSRRQIVDLIVRQVLRERDVTNLMAAWIEDAIEDWTEDHSEHPPQATTREYNKWLEDEIGVLLEDSDIEKVLQTTYVNTYRRLVHGTSAAQALEVLDYPRTIPGTRVPKEVAVAIGKAMAERDAVDSMALLEAARERYQAH